MYGHPAVYGGVLPPLSGTTTETLLPAVNSMPPEEVNHHRTPKADSGLTYALPRKRPRDLISPIDIFQNNQNQPYLQRCGGAGGGLTFLGEDFSGQIHQQQIDIDLFIAQHVIISFLISLFFLCIISIHLSLCIHSTVRKRGGYFLYSLAHVI